MTRRLAALLRDLAATPRGDAPVLSIYLDWSVDGSGRRPSLAALDQRLASCSADLEERGPRRDSFEADRSRLDAYLDAEVPLDARGLVIFACAATQLWVSIPLLVTVETAVACDTAPHLFQLARIIEEHETYLLALAEGQEAQIYILSPERMEQVDSTAAREEVHRVQVGGWSQLRYQRHTGFVLQLHMNDLAAAMQEAVERHDARHIVILTNDAMKGHLRQALPPQLRDLLVEIAPFDRGVGPEALFSSLEPVREEVERNDEMALIGRLEDQLATKGGLALGGEQAVTTALLKGQVDTLLISYAYGGAGGECPSCGALRVGQRQRCPFDGSELVPVELREAMVLHTLRQGGAVEIIGIEGALEPHGGVAALLRFRDDIQSEVGGKFVGDGIA
ncbi:MAG: hypothetical protein HGA45_26765 [Chloroflexales bacterium]|nr:hypothetical protein [Chloroflexales bacterium]